MKPKQTRHKETNIFKFQPFSERITHLDVDVFHRIGHKNEEYCEDETFFYQSLEKWNTLNLSESYEEFRKELPAVQSLPLLLNERDVVVDVILKHLAKRDPLSIQAILDLLAALMKDLRHEVSTSYGIILKKLCDLLSTKNADELEWILTCLAYMFKYLWRYIVKDVDTVFNSLVPLFSDTKPEYIRNFAAESFAYVARKVKNKKDFVKIILRTLEGRPDGIEGCGRLMFEVLRGIRRRFHSFANEFLPLVMDMLYDPTVNFRLLYDLLKHMFSAMCCSIEPKSFSLVWITAFDVICKNVQETERNLESQLFTLKLLKQIVNYKDGVLFVEPQLIISNIVKLLGNVKQENSSEILSEIVAMTLLSRNLHLPQESAHLLIMRVLKLPYEKTVLNFICQVLQYSGFETFILPWVQNYVCSKIQSQILALSTSNNMVLNLLPRIVLEKAAPSLSGIHLETWKRYPLDLTIVSGNGIPGNKECMFEVLFCKGHYNDFTFKESTIEELTGMLLVLPHVKMTQKEVVIEMLKNLMTKTCNELSMYNNSDEVDGKLLQNVLFLFLILLEAQIHIMDFENVKKDCSVKFIVDIILPFAIQPSFISALHAIDLYLTAMMLENQSEMFQAQVLKEICSTLSGNLLSPYHKIRLLTTHIFSLFVTQGTVNTFHFFKVCFEAESVLVSVQSVRDKLRFLEKLSFDVMATKSDYLEIPLQFLLGVLYENFQMLWEPVIQLITSYAHGMGVMDFWKIFGPQLKNAAQNVLVSESCVKYNSLFTNVSLAEMYDDLHAFEDRPDHSNYRVLLWKSLAEFPEICEIKNRDLSPLFFSFLQDEYFKVNSGDGQFCSVKQLQSSDSKDESKQKDICTIQSKPNSDKLKSTQLYHALLAHMKVFAKLRNPKSVYMEPQLREVYFNFLTHRNSNIQKVALDCIMAYKEKYLVPYKENVYGLLNDKTCKTVITLFRIDKETAIIQEEHRAELIPIILRILYGRMLTRTGRGTTGKGSSEFRRSLVLRFVSGCQDNEMLVFLKLAFKVYIPYLRDNVKATVEEIEKNIDLHRVLTVKYLKSSINMLLTVLEKFGALMGNEVLTFVLHVLISIGALISSTLAHKTEIHAGYASGVRSLQSMTIMAVAKFFSHFRNFPWSPDYLNAAFMVFVWHGLEKLPIEGIHSPTALLKLFATWSRDPNYFNLLIKSKDCENISPLDAIMKLLIAPKTQASVTNAIMDITENLLTTADLSKADLEEPEPDVASHAKKAFEELNYGSKILFPHIPVIIQHLKQKLAIRKKKGLSSRDLLILSRVCELEIDSETSTNLLKLLFLAFLKKVDGPEQTVIHLVSTICSLLKHVCAPFQYLKCIAPLFGTVSSVGARKMLCDLLTELAKNDRELKKEDLFENVQLILDINAWDKKWVEQPDFIRRLGGFKSVNEMVEKKTIMLDFGLIIVYSCFYMLKNEKDLSLRDSSAYCLRKLSPFLCKQAKEGRENHIPDTILKLVSAGIREKCNENFHDESVTLLGELVRECCDAHPILMDLKDLACKDDPEVDFFCNIIHLQSHRRGRALMKFCSLAKQMVKPPRTHTMTQVMLPLVSSFLCSEKYTNRKNVIDAGVISIGVVCKLLPWFHYETVLRYYLHKLHTLPAFQKQLVCVVVSILEAFHFDVSLAQELPTDIKDKKSDNVSKEFSQRETIKQGVENELYEDKQVLEENVQEKNMDLNSEEKGDEDGETMKENEIGDDAVDGKDDDDAKPSFEEELEDVMDNVSVDETEEINAKETSFLPTKEPIILRFIKLSESVSTRVIRSITKGLLPQLLRTINQYNKSGGVHKLNRKKTASEQEEEDTMCIPVALAVVKLLQQLPPQYLDQYLPRIFLNTCSFLKSRLESVRRVAREMLKKIMASLGPKYLRVLLSEMNALLTKGYQVHVLIFTMHSVLSSMKVTFKPGDMDECLSQVLDICKMDLFGKASEEKDVAKIVKKVSEARSYKSYDTLNIAAQYITEKCLVDLLLPLKYVLATTYSHSTLVCVSQCLGRIVSGLNENSFVSIESLLMFIYGIATGSIVAFKMDSEQKNAKNEKPKLLLKQSDSFLIPLAPRTRYGALTAKPNLSSDRNAHILVEFGFHLLHILLKRGKASSDEFGTYIDPLVPILQKNIDAKNVKLTTVTLQCFTTIFKMDLPNLKKNIDALTLSIFNLLHKYATAGLSQGEYLDMVIAAFKAVTILIRDVDYHVITDLQLKALLLYIEQDMEEFTKQATAFPLLKAILSRKLDIPEVYEVMSKVARVSIVSEHDHVRGQARQIFYHFIMNYPLGSKAEQHVNFYVSQLSYELEPGRLSAFQIIHRMIATFPVGALSKYAGVFFVAVGASLVNDERASCKKMAAKCLKTLLTRDESERERLFNATLLWLKDQKVAHRRLGAQICGIFVEVESEKFLRYLNVLLPILQTLLTARMSFLHAPGKCVKLAYEANDSEEVKEKKLRLEDHCIFQVLRLTKKICSLCPAFLTDGTWMQHVESIGDAAQDLLGHPHEWIRLEASAVLGHIFASLDIKSLVETMTSQSFIEGRYLFNDTGSKLKSLVLDFCAQLMPDTTGPQLIEQVTKNLAFLSRVMQALPEDLDLPDDNNVKISLLWMIRRMRKIVNMEVVQTPRSYILRDAVFKWIGALVVDLPRERLLTVISQVLSPLARELFNEEDSHPDTLHLARGVTKIIKKKLGVEKYTEQLSKVQVYLATKRATRRRERAQEVIHNPEMAAKRKIKKHQRKKVVKKRKMDEWKGRVAPSKTRKFNASHSDNSARRKRKWDVTDA